MYLPTFILLLQKMSTKIHYIGTTIKKSAQNAFTEQYEGLFCVHPMGFFIIVSLPLSLVAILQMDAYGLEK